MTSYLLTQSRFLEIWWEIVGKGLPLPRFPFTTEGIEIPARGTRCKPAKGICDWFAFFIPWATGFADDHQMLVAF
jgi:hypothetical protein